MDDPALIMLYSPEQVGERNVEKKRKESEDRMGEEKRKGEECEKIGQGREKQVREISLRFLWAGCPS